MTDVMLRQTGLFDILKMFTRNESLEEVLTAICKVIESEASLTLASILLYNDVSQHLFLGVAPSLPAAYNQALRSFAIGPAVGSCGTAAFRRTLVIVDDIAKDPLWQNYREIALQHDLRACWSHPILSSTGELLGTFALYYRRIQRPDDSHLRLIDHASHLAKNRHRTPARRGSAPGKPRAGQLGA